MEVGTLLDKELDELYKRADQGEKRGEMVGLIRRVLAYVLKGVAVGGGLVIAANFLPEHNQAIGVAILVAVAFDTVSSNYKRLIAEVEAGYAFRSLKSRVKSQYNREASPLFERQEKGDAAATDALASLKNQAHCTLAQGLDAIEQQLQKADIEALRSLSLDQERAAVKG